MTPTWTILIATLAVRTDRFTRLLAMLLPQTDEYHGAVTVCAYRNNAERPLSHIRAALLDQAESAYVSFVDDDDLVAEDYVAAILPLLDGVDQVGFRMQHYANGVPSKPTYHSLRYDGWWDDDRGYYRDVSHLNPIRTEIARRVDYRQCEPPEDVAWADHVRQFVTTEHYVGSCMYHYYSSADSTWARPDVAVTTTPPSKVTVDHPNFTYHPEST